MIKRSVYRARNMLFVPRVLYSNGSRTAAFLLPASNAAIASGRAKSAFPRRLGLRLDQRRQGVIERLRCVRKRNAVLRALGPGQTRLNRGKFERKQFRVCGLRRPLVMKKGLLAAIGFDQFDL